MKNNRKQELEAIAKTIYAAKPTRHYEAIEIIEMVYRGVMGVDRQELNLNEASYVEECITALSDTMDAVRCAELILDYLRPGQMVQIMPGPVIGKPHNDG